MRSLFFRLAALLVLLPLFAFTCEEEEPRPQVMTFESAEPVRCEVHYGTTPVFLCPNQFKRAVFIDDGLFEGVKMASFDVVTSLEEINCIPATGWSDTTSRVEIRSGYGYVARDLRSETYCRIYVENFIYSKKGQMTGVILVLQSPFLP